jgi:hypothetical protein
VAQRRKFAAILLAAAAGIALAVIVFYSVSHPSDRTLPKVIVGTNDAVYYSHAAAKADAESLGHALQLTGFFNNRGTSVLLSKGTSGTIVSFALKDGAWDHPETVRSFEEIGRRIAGSLGGYPIHVRLCDLKWGVHKEVAVGKIIAGVRDEVYYYGSATMPEAEALGRALQSNGYLVDSGASVVLSKDGVTSISFVLGDGAWNRLGTVSAFEDLVRKVAPSVGGLPVNLRLLNSNMEIEKEVAALRAQ